MRQGNTDENEDVAGAVLAPIAECFRARPHPDGMRAAVNRAELPIRIPPEIRSLLKDRLPYPFSGEPPTGRAGQARN